MAAEEPTLSDVMECLDGIDKRLQGLESHVEALCTRVGSLERTVSRKFAAMGAGFGMMKDQLVDDRS